MSIKPWKLVNSKIVHETPWIEVKEDLCSVDNKELTYTYNRRKDAGPVIIPEDTDRKLWLVKQYRHPIRKIIWQFPAEGKLDGESWQETAQRGLAEEIGKHAKTIIKIGEFHPDPGGIEQTAHIFLASDLNNITIDKEHISEEEIEELEVQKFSLDEIDVLIDNGQICDGWTLSALYLYKRFKTK